MGSITCYDVTPVAKPRMTVRDKWKKRKCVQKYWAFCDAVKVLKIEIQAGDMIIFRMKIPESLSNAKKEEMEGKPHTQRPDLDNLLKAIFDAVFEEDSHIHAIIARKIWSKNPGITVVRGED